MKKIIFCTALLLVTSTSFSQIGLGPFSNPAKAELDVSSRDKGVLVPRVSYPEKDIIDPDESEFVWDTTRKCFRYYLDGLWEEYSPCNVETIFDCANAILTPGSIDSNDTNVNISGSIAYINGSVYDYDAQSIPSTGVTGLTLSIPAGTLNSGSGNLSFTITGNPGGVVGTASFIICVLGAPCTLEVNVESAMVTSLDCDDAYLLSEIESGVNNSVLGVLPYTGGNGGNYAMKSVASTGVTGLTLTINAGMVNLGSGNILFTITGNPGSATGTASFIISLGGQTCTIAVDVQSAMVTSLDCDNHTLNGDIQPNVSANVSGSLPYTGGDGNTYSQFNVLSTGVQGLTLTIGVGTLAIGDGNFPFSITGTALSEGTASFAINIAGQTCVLNVLVQSATVTALDCDNYTLNGAISPNIAHNVSGTLPYTGGNGGNYSSFNTSSIGVSGLTLTINAGTLATGNGSFPFTVTGTPTVTGTAQFAINIAGETCLLDVFVSSATVTSIDCDNYSLSSPVITGQTANSSGTIPYTGGNGEAYGVYTRNSTGITGLTLTISAGTLANGDGNFAFTITGTPSGEGTASFAITIGGQSCTLDVPVGSSVSLDITLCSGLTGCSPYPISGHYRRCVAGTFVALSSNYTISGSATGNFSLSFPECDADPTLGGRQCSFAPDIQVFDVASNTRVGRATDVAHLSGIQGACSQSGTRNFSWDYSETNLIPGKTYRLEFYVRVTGGGVVTSSQVYCLNSYSANGVLTFN